MPILVRSMLVCQSVVDLRFFVLVSWSGERPALTLWFSPPRGTEGATRFSLTAHTLPSSTSCMSSVLLGCVVCGDTLVLLWVIGHMIRQDAIDHADGFVTDRDESPLSCAFPRGLVLASLIVQTSPKHPLRQCGNKLTVFHGVRYAVETSSKSHNCGVGTGNRG